jgi:tRNA nucleotidyltransferase (CCA-adding enzyme)
MTDPAVVLDRLHERPGGEELVRLSKRHEDVALIGGAVRDLLLGRPPKELDVVVSADPGRFAGDLLGMLELRGEGTPVLTLHDRFETASVVWPSGRVDIARRRAESYPVPGALPEVRPGTEEEDLVRRDFTVNAISVHLSGSNPGELVAADRALDDLDGRRLRVLHDRSFIDDPTRLLRLARYGARLGFEVEPHTAGLAEEAVRSGAMDTVSGGRLGAELRLALEEADPLGSLRSLSRLDVLMGLGLARDLDPGLTGRALELLPADGRVPELLLALLVFESVHDGGKGEEVLLRSLLDRLEFAAGERDRALRAAFGAGALSDRMLRTSRRSELYEALVGWDSEGVALAGALVRMPDGEAPEEQARLWFDELRHIRLSITGDDLLDAGLAPGPEIGMRLEAALARKLDGELAGAGAPAELQAALEAGT